MSTEVGAFEAKNRLSELLRQAERGQRIYITRRGRRVAVLVGVEPTGAGGEAGSGAEGESPVAQARRLRDAAKSGPESMRELIEAGRR